MLKGKTARRLAISATGRKNGRHGWAQDGENQSEIRNENEDRGAKAVQNCRNGDCPGAAASRRRTSAIADVRIHRADLG
jgi:hypothetical protein